MTHDLEKPHEGTTPEIERRFLVIKGVAPTQGIAPQHITQRYPRTLTPGVSTRLRHIAGEKHWHGTRKDGIGLVRGETPTTFSAEQVHVLEPAFPMVLTKDRYLLEGGWEYDVFGGRLSGIRFLEREFKLGESTEVITPDWVEEWVEVTETLNNFILCSLSDALTDDHAFDLTAHILRPQIPIVVLTGGPCSGKSTAIEQLRALHGDKIMFVPEVVTALHQLLHVLPPTANDLHGLEYQRNLYAIQRAYEAAVMNEAIRNGKMLVIVDRGSLDSGAYLPGGTPQLLQMVGSTLEVELARYHSVLFLATPPEDVYNAMRANNPARHENYHTACATAQRTLAAWRGPTENPKLIQIQNGADWKSKFDAILNAITPLLAQ